MYKYPNFEEFMLWCKENPEKAKQLYEEELAIIINDLEADDYFGTEGINKRFS